MNTKREHNVNCENNIDTKRRKIEETVSNTNKNFCVTLDSTTNDYYLVMKFISRLYIEQNEANDGINSSFIEREGHNELLFIMFPEDHEITIKYHNKLITYIRTKLKRVREITGDIMFLPGLKIIAGYKKILDDLFFEATGKRNKISIDTYLIQDTGRKSDQTVMNNPLEDIKLSNKNEFESVYSVTSDDEEYLTMSKYEFSATSEDGEEDVNSKSISRDNMEQFYRDKAEKYHYKFQATLKKMIASGHHRPIEFKKYLEPFSA